MLKIACGSNIDDIRGNTTFVTNYLYFLENSITIDSLKFCLKVVVYASALHQKITLKSDTERRKYARFSGLVLFFAC